MPKIEVSDKKVMFSYLQKYSKGPMLINKFTLCDKSHKLGSNRFYILKMFIRVRWVVEFSNTGVQD